jgi:hypothetical protein
MPKTDQLRSSGKILTLSLDQVQFLTDSHLRAVFGGELVRKQHLRRVPLCLSISLALVGLSGVQIVHASPVLLYQFPASWNGTGTTVTDLSGAGHNGTTTGAPTLSSNVPPVPFGSQSIHTDAGGLRTNATSLLTNPVIAAAGGFRYDATIFWDNTDNTQHIQKIIDYAGTDYLQLQAVDTTLGTALLRFGFNDTPAVGPTLNTIVVPNTWYDVTGIFDTQGNAVAADGSLSGLASLIVNGVTIASENVTKTTAGDLLVRRIGVGNFSNSANALLQFHGDINNASVQLVPEPTILATLGVAMSALMVLRRRRA